MKENKMKIIWYHGIELGKAKKYSDIQKIFVEFCVDKYKDTIEESDETIDMTPAEISAFGVALESKFNLGHGSGLYNILEYEDCYIIDWIK